MSFDLGKVEMRALRASDFAAIFQLAETLEEAPHWPREAYERLIHQDRSGERTTLVAVEQPGGEVVGFVVARLIPPEAELESIAVARTWQRRGIGRRLLASLVSQLRETGIEKLHLEVRAKNRAGIGLYSSFGFKETGRRPGYYSSPVDDAVLMTLALN